eukprot:PhF_6_TR33003/c0_g1_i1/m.48632
MVLRQALKWPHKFIDTEDALKAAAKLLKASATTGQGVAVDIEAFCVEKHSRHLGQVSLLQLAGPVDPNVYIVDVVTLGADRVAHYMKRVISHPQIRKYMFDCRKDVEAMSTQMGLSVVNALDLQLYHTATLWSAKGTNRRSNLDWVLQNLAHITSSEEMKAVEAAFLVGNRKVWDERPLPDHLAAYAANDVRHLLVLSEYFQQHHADLETTVAELTQKYIDYYGTGQLVETDIDPAANLVSTDWLRELFGKKGKCTHCGMSGHDVSNCFKKDIATLKCSHCGQSGHLTSRCYKLHPEKHKCSHCGQSGHLESKCFLLHPCTKCGGKHSTASCNRAAKETPKPKPTGNNNPTQQQPVEGAGRPQQGGSFSSSPRGNFSSDWGGRSSGGGFNNRGRGFNSGGGGNNTNGNGRGFGNGGRRY